MLLSNKIDNQEEQETGTIKPSTVSSVEVTEGKEAHELVCDMFLVECTK